MKNFSPSKKKRPSFFGCFLQKREIEFSTNQKCCTAEIVLLLPSQLVAFLTVISFVENKEAKIYFMCPKVSFIM